MLIKLCDNLKVKVNMLCLCYFSLCLFPTSYSRERVERKKKRGQNIYLCFHSSYPCFGLISLLWAPGKVLAVRSSGVLPGSSKSNMCEGEILFISQPFPSHVNKVKVIVNAQ